EVRQDDEDAFDLAAVFRKQVGTFACVGVRLNAAELCILRAEHDRLDGELLEEFDDIFPSFANQHIRKEVAIADNDADSGGVLGHVFSGPRCCIRGSGCVQQQSSLNLLSKAPAQNCKSVTQLHNDQKFIDGYTLWWHSG